MALCDDDLHVRSVPLVGEGDRRTRRSGRRQRIRRPPLGHRRYRLRAVLHRDRPAFRSRTVAAAGRCARRGARVGIGHRQDSTRAGHGRLGCRATAHDPSLVHEAYPAIAEGCRAHDVSRCWLYFGLIALSIGKLDDADERFGHAERHWREIEKPLHIHRILLQRSWVDIFRGDFDAARERTNEARELLDSWPRHSWLQYARLDDHLGSIWRADALADPQNATDKLERAAELKVPAALAVDSVRHSIADADAQDALGDPCFCQDPGRRFRRRLGVGEHRTGQRTRRISQCARHFQRRAGPGGRRVDRHRDGRGTPRDRRRVRPCRRRRVAVGWWCRADHGSARCRRCRWTRPPRRS